MGEGEDGVEAKCRSARYAEEGLDVISGAWFNGVGVASKRDFCMLYFSLSNSLFSSRGSSYVQ